MDLIYAAKGYEFFANYDEGAEVYEIFLDETAETYVGCADTLKEAKAAARWWLKDHLEA